MVFFPSFAALFILAHSATASDPDPHCENGIRTENNWLTRTYGVKAICCPSTCGQCGGALCPGANCCIGGVVDMPSCDVSGPPCVIRDDCINGGLRADSSWLQENYNVRFTCCPKTCGQCGGSGCDNIMNHTVDECCAYHIRYFGDSYDDVGRPPYYRKFIKDEIEADLSVQLTPIHEDYFQSGFAPFNFDNYLPFAYEAYESYSSFNEAAANQRYVRDDYHLELKLLPGDINPFISDGAFNPRTELSLRKSAYGGTAFEETVFTVTTYFEDENFDATFFQITQPPNTVPLFTLEVNNREPHGRFIQVRFRGPNPQDRTGKSPSHFPETINTIFRNYAYNMNREVRWDVHFLPSLDPTQGFIKVYREGVPVWNSENHALDTCVYTAGWYKNATSYSETCHGTNEEELNTQMGVYAFAGLNQPFPGPEPMTIKYAHLGIFKVEN